MGYLELFDGTEAYVIQVEADAGIGLRVAAAAGVIVDEAELSVLSGIKSERDDNGLEGIGAGVVDRRRSRKLTRVCS